MNVRLYLTAVVVLGLAGFPAGAGGDKEGIPVPKPGPEHKLLAKLEGKWDAKVKAWFGPGEPTQSTGVAVRKMIMDGLYLEERYQGEFLNTKFKGLGLTGYDTKKKKYVSAWIDNFDTGIMTSEGTYDAAKKTWTYHGADNGPMGPMKTRDVITIVSDDEEHFEMYRTPKDGKEFKVMEITYTRSAKAKKGG